MKSIKIAQSDIPVTEGAGTILDRALRSGIPYPHVCRSGECGQCKTHLISGHVKQLPSLDCALTADDRRANLILACRSIAESDVEVAWMEEENKRAPKVSQFTVELCNSEIRGRVLIMQLKPTSHETSFNFIPGQYVNFFLPGCPPRPYSMASIPDSSFIEFHIELVEKGCVSHYLANKLNIGDQFTIEGPYGDAYLRTDDPGPLLAVGAGTGLAPILSIVTSSLIKTPERRISLIYIERDSSEFYLKKQLLQLSECHPQLTVSCIITNEINSNEHTLHEQLAEKLLQLPFSLPTASLYIAGSPYSVNAVATVARQLGAQSDQIHADAFTRSPESERSDDSIFHRLTRIFSNSA